MFEFFLNEYYEKVYKEANRKLKKLEIIMLVIFFASSIILSLAILFQWKKIIFSSVIFEAVMIVFIEWYTKTRNKKHSDNLIKEYKKKRIDALIGFMKNWKTNSENDSKNNLYNIFGVEWALACTKNKLEKNHSIQELQDMGQNLYIYIFPVVTLCIGAIVEKSNAEETLNLSISLILIAIILISAITAIKIFVNWILTPKRFALEILRDDLEYIKVILQSENRDS